ncbi:LacI family DNA-binding transcriptional regulator [uncultured Corynebacterium sp.]|uniref:LacI family DNA-binding transcriptional regulator n=1 Tax=uncultured Corynebacterium sp. TaxID=159447 RepID=UPI0025D2F9CA|nr:LacI family DNA-binding transcriptional regulator [uncultured Corynebacterium sp.]
MSPRRSPKNSHKATLASLAEAVGVSRTTVSNAYNKPDHLSPETRARIFATADKLGYSGPDPAARSLRTRRADAIGVLFTDELTYAFEDRSSVDFLAGLAESCQALDSSLVLIPAAPGRAASGINRVAQAAVDGFVVYSVASDDPTLEVVASRGLPTVVCDQPYSTPKLKDYAFVGIDDHAAIQPGVQQLIEAGHRKIGVLCIRLDREANAGEVSPQRLRTAHMHVQKHRVEGIVDVVGAAHPDLAEDIPIVECYINDADGTREAARALLDAHPDLTAVACTTDSLALAVIQCAADRGLSVPGDLSVTGFDGIDLAMQQQITTVSQPNKDKGRTAGHVLQDLISDATRGRVSAGASSSRNATTSTGAGRTRGQVSAPHGSHTLLETTLIMGRTVGPPQ